MIDNDVPAIGISLIKISLGTPHKLNPICKTDVNGITLIKLRWESWNDISYISIRLLAQTFGSFEENLLKGLYTQGWAWGRKKRKGSNCPVLGWKLLGRKHLAAIRTQRWTEVDRILGEKSQDPQIILW